MEKGKSDNLIDLVYYHSIDIEVDTVYLKWLIKTFTNFRTILFKRFIYNYFKTNIGIILLL